MSALMVIMCLIEQIEVDVAVESSSADLMLMFCDPMESLDFILESSSTDRSEDISLSCGESVTIPNLTNTLYTLSRRYLMGQTCEVNNFVGSKLWK